MCNRSLSMKYFQFFKICKPFDKKREKTLIQQLVRKEKLRKFVLFSISDCFTRLFKRIINHFFYFACSSAAQFLLFEIRMMQEISKGEIGNNKQLGMANIYLSYLLFQKQFQSLSNEHNTKCYVISGVWTIAPEENCPPAWVRVQVRFRVKFWELFSLKAIV